MPDRRTTESVDALAAFPPEEDNGQPVAAPAPLRGPRDSSPVAVVSITEARVRALINSVQRAADKVDALSITTVATTKRLTRWIIGLSILTGLIVLTLLAQTYFWLTITGAGR